MMPAIEITEQSTIFQKFICPIKRYPYLKNIILRSLIVFTSGIIAASIPYFGLFINLSGAFASTILAFIVPIILYNKVFKNEISKTKKIFHYFLITIGIFLGGISIVMSIVEINKTFLE